MQASKIAILSMKEASMDMIFSSKKTHKCEFLGQMKLVVPWKSLVQMVTLFYPAGHMGRLLFSPAAMLRTAQLDAFRRLADDSTILRFVEPSGFPSWLQKHKFFEQVMVGANELLVRKVLEPEAGTAVAAAIQRLASTKDFD